ncbi:MAG: DUF3786 domain-containing protein [Treponema sp.]|nr:DUF3786 domain-containing protein [Treponema sp.]
MKTDQARVIEKLKLPHDGDFLYVRFLGETLSVSRMTGKIAGIPDDDTMTPAAVYDYLCHSRADRLRSGQWVSTAGIGLEFHRGNDGMFAETARYLDGRGDALAALCRKLGGTERTPGDVSYELTLFDEIPVWLQFWRGDDEFPAKLVLLWDKNITQWVHYETLYYIASMLFTRLKKELDIN